MKKIDKIVVISLLLFNSVCASNFFITAKVNDDKADASEEAKKIFVPKDYRTIREAIENSKPGDKIFVDEGIFEEPKGLTLKKGRELCGKSTGKTKLLLGGGGMFLEGENNVKDITLHLEKGEVYLNSADNITLQNCIIEGSGGINNGLLIEKSENVKIINCTITNQRVGILIRHPPVGLLIKNSIISHNRRVGIFISTEAEGDRFDYYTGVMREPEKKGGGELKVELEYNNAWGSPQNYYGISPGKSDIAEDPKFVGEGNYNLQLGSPCIDAGDLDKKYNDPDGTRNDLGALPYGRKK